MQVTPVPSPVIVGPSGLPAAICTGSPVIADGGKTYCILGLRIAGNDADLEKARTSLLIDHWEASIGQTSPKERVLIADARGKDLAAIGSVLARVRAGTFGALTASVVSVPVPPNPK